MKNSSRLSVAMNELTIFLSIINSGMLKGYPAIAHPQMALFNRLTAAGISSDSCPRKSEDKTLPGCSPYIRWGKRPQPKFPLSRPDCDLFIAQTVG